MIVAYWKIKLSSIHTKREATQQLEQLLIHIAWDQPPLAPSKSDVIVAKLRDAQQTIQTICKEATTHRLEFLQERAALEALAGNKEVAKVLRRIATAKATKVCYKLLPKYLKPSMTQGGITHIKVAMEN